MKVAPTRPRIEALFDDAYGAEPEGVWAAPGRINLLGGHTADNEGYALPIALPQRVLAAVGRRDDGMFVARSRQIPDEAVMLDVDELRPGAVDGWGAYLAGAAWAVTATGVDLPGLEILIDSDLPSGAGLASSAALECAVVTALNDLLELGLSRLDQARLAHLADRDFVGGAAGPLDQLASLLGDEGHASFVDCRDLSHALVPVNFARAGLQLLIIDTRVAPTYAASALLQRQHECSEAANALGVPALRDIGIAGMEEGLAHLAEERHRRRVRHVVTENARVLGAVALLKSGRAADIGPLLTASHASLRDDYEVSCPELDLAVTAALDAGALGARMSGDGFGGSGVALARAADNSRICAAISAAYTEQGYRPPEIFAATPAAGAGRVAEH